MGWSAGSSPQPFIMGTVLPLLYLYSLHCDLCVVGWGRAWEGCNCTTVGYLLPNSQFLFVLNFFWGKNTFLHLPFVDFNHNGWYLHEVSLNMIYLCIYWIINLWGHYLIGEGGEPWCRTIVWKTINSCSWRYGLRCTYLAI